MQLNNGQIRHLRGLAHHLKPVLMIGDKGLTEGVLAELELVLETHELIKVTIADSDREVRRALSEELCQHSGAGLVQVIGKISVLYRPAKQPKLSLSD